MSREFVSIYELQLTSSYFLRDVYDDDVLNEKTHLFSLSFKVNQDSYYYESICSEQKCTRRGRATVGESEFERA